MASRNPTQKIDWLVVTASSRAQASGYRTMLRERAACGLLSGVRRWLVVPDPKDLRAGSGNATLVALARVLAARLAELTRSRKPSAKLHDLLVDQRVLIIHSGGDSRRLPAYAASGKLFLPLDRRHRDGTSATMFDLILADLVRVHAKGARAGSTLIASGDVLLNASSHAIDLRAPGITGVAFPAPAKVASKHGVYVHDGKGLVTRFLQKPSADELASHGALTPDGRALVDSGIVSIDAHTAIRLLRASGLRLDPDDHRLRFSGEFSRIIEGVSRPMDLYEDVLMAASGVPGGPPLLCKALDGVPFRVRVISTCDFLHIGTTEQLLSIAAQDPRVRDPGASQSGPVMLATTGASHARADAPCWIDACEFEASATLRGGNVLVGLDVTKRLALPSQWGVVVVPLTDGRFVSIAFGIGDDFKTSLDKGATLGGSPLADMIAQMPEPERVWPAPGATAPRGESGRTLYDVHIWPIVRSRAAAIEAVRWLWTPGAKPSREWLRAQHTSVAEAMRLCDREAMIERRRALAGRAAADACRSRKQRGIAALPLADLRPDEAASMLEAQTELAFHAEPPSRRASEFWIGGEIARIAGRDPRPLREAALLAVADAVSDSSKATRVHDRAAETFDPLLPEQASWASAPARIDLAGGWSDTPPICHDLGGTVVNAAIRVGGHAAVHAIVRRTDRPGIAITSTDLGRTARIRSISDLQRPFDPTHWSALACAAVALNAGTERPARSIGEVTERMWRGPGGLHVTTYSTLPKGSGLGTSSILGATLLAALANASGSTPPMDALFARTLTLEQMLGTGGGWQDQAGGLTPGVKLLTTPPGARQVPRMTHLADGLFTDLDGPRMLLYFTGVRRLARNILHGVVGSYLARNASTIRAIHALKAGAVAMADAIARADQSEFNARLVEYWALKRDIDPGASHPLVDAAVSLVEKDLLSWELPGAGGGGYLFMIARDLEAAARIQRTLTRYAPNEQARFADVSVDPTGLRVLRT